MKQKKQAFNPFLPSYEYVPDGEPYVFGDRVYIYGSHDEFNGREFCMNDYVCWSASVDDLSDWKYEGVIFKKSQDPEYSKKTLLFAPDVAQGTDGRYYLYYSPKGRSVTGVAVSDTPTGPFEFYGYVSDCNKDIAWQNDGDPFQFDPAVFVDDDGKAYLYTGFAPVSKFGFMMKKRFHKSFKGAYVVALKDDMKTIKTILKVFIGLIGATLIYNGIMWGFAPESNFAQYEVVVNSLGGLNMIKSDIGGPLIAAGLFSILYALRGEKWYLPTLLMGSSYLLVRTVSIITDSYSQVALMGIIIEIIFVALVVVSRLLEKRTS